MKNTAQRLRAERFLPEVDAAPLSAAWA